MTPSATLTRYRTLIIEGHEGRGRARLTAELTHFGFEVRRLPPDLHHLDPALPYRELLAGPGRLAVAGGLVRELVYGPLRRGRSRVTWIQALDFAEAVAERDGALLHLTAPGRTTRAQCPEAAEAATAYARAYSTLAQHVPVVTLDLGDPGCPAGAPLPRQCQLLQKAGQLTIG